MGFFEAMAPFYDSFMKLMGNEKNQKLIVGKIDPKKHKDILDVGGGTGSLAKKILEKGAQVSVVDSSEKMLSIASKKGLPEKNLIIADASNLPFEKERFDLLICADALHHFKQIDKSLDEMNRVLKKNGELIILEFDPQKIITKLLKLFEKTFGEPAEFITPGALKKILAQNGIKGELENLNNWQYIFHGKKDHRS